MIRLGLRWEEVFSLSPTGLCISLTKFAFQDSSPTRLLGSQLTDHCIRFGCRKRMVPKPPGGNCQSGQAKWTQPWMHSLNTPPPVPQVCLHSCFVQIWDFPHLKRWWNVFLPDPSEFKNPGRHRILLKNVLIIKVSCSHNAKQCLAFPTGLLISLCTIYP